MRFYLGTHESYWLRDTEVPLFVSHRRLARNRTVPRASAPWALDSGGFTELSLFGRWLTTPAEYIAAVRRYAAEVGRLEWCAPQDWMCEPPILARTGLTVAAHQARTVDSFHQLAAAGLPVIPVLQGWTVADYHRHVADYARSGVNLETLELVGLGSVCRRQSTAAIGELVASLAPLKLLGFGVKLDGLDRYGWCLASADSLAWSYDGRRIRPCPHTGRVSCNNCRPHALAWRARAVADRPPRPVQLAASMTG